MVPEAAVLRADLRSQTAIVSGAAHGFGRAICLALAASGARVWAVDILADEVEQTAAQCRSAGGWCEARALDITQPQAVQALVATACSGGRIPPGEGGR